VTINRHKGSLFGELLRASGILPGFDANRPEPRRTVRYEIGKRLRFVAGVGYPAHCDQRAEGRGAGNF